MAKKNKNIDDEDEDEDCRWCQTDNAEPKAEFERLRLAELTDLGLQDLKTDEETPRHWVSCTRCNAWYHQDCVVLKELVSKVEPTPSQGGRQDAGRIRFSNLESSGSLPSEVVHELKLSGMDWDWGSSTDKWSVPMVRRAAI